MLEGEAELSGITPITFGYPLIGEYRLTARKHGFEDYQTRLVLDPSQPQQLNIDLAPKTRVKAALRSMIIPGWGQSYSGRKTKSLLFGAAFTGAVISYLYLNDEFKTKKNEYFRLRSEYDVAVAGGGAIDILADKHRAMIKAQQVTYDAENDRRVTIALTAGIWGLNVLDALLFSPGERATFSVKGLTVAPSTSSSRAGLTFSMAF